MKILNIILIIFLLNSCTENKNSKKEKKVHPSENKIIKPQFQSIIDSSNVNGSILIYDLKNDLFYSNNFDWAKTGRLPASTFKIVNSIIALETKVVKNDSTLFRWNGEKRDFKVWEQDLILKDAFKYSCVPCYQEIAREIGVKRMNEYLKKLEYKDMKVNSKNIDKFWLEGDSKINQFQQIEFIKHFSKSELGISKRTEDIMKKIFFIEKYGKYNLNGKTGLSVRNGNYNGWFVGYIESKENNYFFATNIEPKSTLNKKLFPNLRKQITIKALNIIK
ncbi:penicillin-binding transpeptidase domain-containing protein [Polaribacter sargassicola]|uniref:penicillin-binding transpeptidase domain-containing protein n=1 Tax=Polaribacter sargassicola TaxID=2836891 RepID=UPI001F2AEBC5|nr:penicillin-binding transpeptidase domain-containing protein [Polaribacter sp. DS7-9]MCG1036401.1 class D beta-lactamase [Polaribacter sp. DS7-9]